MRKTSITTALLVSVSLIAACQKPLSEASDNSKLVDVSASISKTMAKASEEVRKEVSNGDISLDDGPGKPKAEITALGDLLSDNKPLVVTTEQRQLLIKHRQLLKNIAIAGMEIGMQGAHLATQSIGDGMKSVYTGETYTFEKKLESEAKKIEHSAKSLCDQLPILLQSQRKLAAALPEFKPYATLNNSDIDECHAGK